MALSFDIRLTWEQFWEDQQNNPNCELAFLYEGKIYYLYYETYQKRYGEYMRAASIPNAVEEKHLENASLRITMNCKNTIDIRPMKNGNLLWIRAIRY